MELIEGSPLKRYLRKVRYTGVNAPEIPHPEAPGWREGGARALAVNQRLVAGQTARLKLDLQRRDHYGQHHPGTIDDPGRQQDQSLRTGHSNLQRDLHRLSQRGQFRFPEWGPALHYNRKRFEPG